jgi:hypothetical protein
MKYKNSDSIFSIIPAYFTYIHALLDFIFESFPILMFNNQQRWEIVTSLCPNMNPDIFRKRKLFGGVIDNNL